MDFDGFLKWVMDNQDLPEEYNLKKALEKSAEQAKGGNKETPSQQSVEEAMQRLKERMQADEQEN